MSLAGLENVVANLNKEIKAIEGRSMKGLIRAAVIVQRSAEETPPLVPVGETGVLHNSWFTSPGYIGSNPFLTMGYSANYAVYVHEMVGAHFQLPGAGAKWFQASFRRNKEEILAVIKEEAAIK
jgi:hypothetical protein